MKEGDSNAQFFHRTVNAHIARNKILRLQDDSGNWTTHYDEVNDLSIAYFESMFNEPNTSVPAMNWLGNSLNNDQDATMITQVSHKEIKEAHFSLKNDSAPGPDGYSVEFYKSNWDLVGKDVLDAIGYLFSHNYLYYPLNSTTISFIPKTDSPVKMKDFRPISCCNVSYKIISKILANRIKLLLPFLVDENQSAFVKRRNIQDNILLMHDLVQT